MKKKEKLKNIINLSQTDRQGIGRNPIGPPPGEPSDHLKCEYQGSNWWTGCKYWTCNGPPGSGISYGVSICNGKMDYWAI